MIDPWLTLGGLFAGTVVGLTGLGGAAIVTPMLLLLFNVPAPIAVSTDLVSAAGQYRGWVRPSGLAPR